MPKHQASILVNRTGHDVEFRQDGIVYQHKKGEAKAYDGFVANHALNTVNTGLEVYTKQIEEEMKQAERKEMPDYESLPWKKLVSMASERDVYDVGMNRSEVLKALKEKWLNENKPAGETK